MIDDVLFAIRLDLALPQVNHRVERHRLTVLPEEQQVTGPGAR
ncbi:MAG: hypothetical protein ABR902_14260 [Candidatus Korobacteraceae bacterium]